MANDPHIEQAEQASDKESQKRFADLFDVRRVIGGLFGVYGAILVIASFWASDEDIDRAQGMNANLWVGLSLLLVAAIFFGWALSSPVGAQLVDEDGNGDPGSTASAPAARDEPGGGSRREDA